MLVMQHVPSAAAVETERRLAAALFDMDSYMVREAMNQYTSFVCLAGDVGSAMGLTLAACRFAVVGDRLTAHVPVPPTVGAERAALLARTAFLCRNAHNVHAKDLDNAPGPNPMLFPPTEPTVLGQVHHVVEIAASVHPAFVPTITGAAPALMRPIPPPAPLQFPLFASLLEAIAHQIPCFQPSGTLGASCDALVMDVSLRVRGLCDDYGYVLVNKAFDRVRKATWPAGVRRDTSFHISRNRDTCEFEVQMDCVLPYPQVAPYFQITPAGTAALITDHARMRRISFDVTSNPT